MEKQKALDLSLKMHQYAKDYELYEYMDCVENEEESIENMATALCDGTANIENLIALYQEIIDDDDYPEAIEEAKIIISLLKEVKGEN